jgi:acyl carrier protein
VQLVLCTSGDGGISFRLFSANDERGEGLPGWKLHTSGTFRPGGVHALPGVPEEDSVARVRERCREEISRDEFYSVYWKEEEHHIGDSFRLVQRAFRRDGEVLVEICAPEAPAEAGSSALPVGLLIAEASVLEACGQAAKLALPGHRPGARPGVVYIGLGIDRCYYATSILGGNFWFHIRSRSGWDGDHLVADGRLLDDHGSCIACLEGMRFWRIGPETLPRVMARRPAGGPHRGAASSAQEVRSARPAERRGLIESYLLLQVSAMSGLPCAEIDPEASLRDLGLDSLRSMDLTRWIERDLGIALGAVVLLEGPSPRRLSEELAQALLAASSKSSDAG